MSRWRRRGMVLLACAALCGGLYGLRGLYLPSLARWLDVGQRPVRADYLMVLGGDDNTRPFAAAALVKRGFASHVLLSKAQQLPNEEEGSMPGYNEIDRSVLVARGVPEANISVIGQPCQSTFDEAQALASFLAASPPATVLIVTSDFHSRRSRWVFHRVLGPRAAGLTVVSAPTDQFPLEHWWRNYYAFLAITSEYLKLAFYLFRYGQLGYWLAASFAAAAAAWAAYRWRRAYRLSKKA
jgi:uncharacterized SAM-binding protein YcdF (DUF218 family)